jgi:hypothetical protein
MQFHRALVIVASHVIQRTDFDDASVVDQDVNSIEMIDDFPDCGLDLIAIEQITFDSKNISTARSEISFGTHEFFSIAGDESDLSALFADMSRQHEPKAARATGDEGDLVAQRILRRANHPHDYPTAK